MSRRDKCTARILTGSRCGYFAVSNKADANFPLFGVVFFCKICSSVGGNVYVSKNNQESFLRPIFQSNYSQQVFQSPPGALRNMSLFRRPEKYVAVLWQSLPLLVCFRLQFTLNTKLYRSNVQLLTKVQCEEKCVGYDKNGRRAKTPR